MATTDIVTIGVPVHRGELFIEETLRSIQSQTHQEI
jgi:glycosyltransferase involved in cell wall biosynthesis